MTQATQVLSNLGIVFSNPVLKTIYGYGTPESFAELLDEVIGHFAETQEDNPTPGFSDTYYYMRSLRDAVRQLPDKEPVKEMKSDYLPYYEKATKEQLIALMVAKDNEVQSAKNLMDSYEKREKERREEERKNKEKKPTTEEQSYYEKIGRVFIKHYTANDTIEYAKETIVEVVFLLNSQMDEVSDK